MSEAAASGQEPGASGQEPGAASQSNPPLPFLYVDSPASYHDEAALIVRIPIGIRSKQKLLAILAERLRFPGYFGWNWDALEECLSDLSWLPADQRVAIVHADLPFGSGGENRGIYQRILACAAENSAVRHPIRVVFPAARARATHDPAAHGPASST